MTLREEKARAREFAAQIDTIADSIREMERTILNAQEAHDWAMHRHANLVDELHDSRVDWETAEVDLGRLSLELVVLRETKANLEREAQALLSLLPEDVDGTAQDEPIELLQALDIVEAAEKEERKGKE